LVINTKRGAVPATRCVRNTHRSVCRPVAVRTTNRPPCMSFLWGLPSGNPVRNCKWLGPRRVVRPETRIPAPDSSAPCIPAL